MRSGHDNLISRTPEPGLRSLKDGRPARLSNRTWRVAPPTARLRARNHFFFVRPHGKHPIQCSTAGRRRVGPWLQLAQQGRALATAMATAAATVGATEPCRSAAFLSGAGRGWQPAAGDAVARVGARYPAHPVAAGTARRHSHRYAHVRPEHDRSTACGTASASVRTRQCSRCRQFHQCDAQRRPGYRPA
jgi:hypothetical protein